FVDNGLLRAGEVEEVLGVCRDRMGLDVRHVDAAARFLEHLRGVEEPEQKRRIIGGTFIEVFEEEARQIPDVGFLAQGTLYPDVIESTSVRGPSATIKSHHNVGGLPERMRFELLEPLRELFKDEVRNHGRVLGVPQEIVGRQPFPGPGLAIRVIGAVDRERLAIVRGADAVVQEEVRRAELYAELWQAFAVLLPVKTVGVMGDERTYENVVAIRAVHSTDGMTADWARLPADLLACLSARIINEVPGVNRVVYAISAKPPATPASARSSSADIHWSSASAHRCARRATSSRRSSRRCRSLSCAMPRAISGRSSTSAGTAARGWSRDAAAAPCASRARITPG